MLLEQFTFTFSGCLTHALDLILPRMRNPRADRRLLTLAHRAVSYLMRSLKQVLAILGKLCRRHTLL